MKMHITVGATYRLKTDSGFRFYKCTGVYLGALKQESVAGFECLDKNKNGEILIPLDMISKTMSFHPV